MLPPSAGKAVFITAIETSEKRPRRSLGVE